MCLDPSAIAYDPNVPNTKKKKKKPKPKTWFTIPFDGIWKQLQDIYYIEGQEPHSVAHGIHIHQRSRSHVVHVVTPKDPDWKGKGQSKPRRAST